MANGHGGQRSLAEGVLDVSREKVIMKDCWLRCDACRKWRLVEPEALPSLTDVKYKQSLSGLQDADWKAWLDEAPVRYAAFMQEQSVRRPGDPSGGEPAAESGTTTAGFGDDAAEDVPPDL